MDEAKEWIKNIIETLDKAHEESFKKRKEEEKK